jgi:hypothetical protein
LVLRAILCSHTVKTAVVAAALARLAVLVSEVLLLTATLILCPTALSTRSSLLERRLALFELEIPVRLTFLSLLDLSATTSPIYCMTMVNCTVVLVLRAILYSHTVKTAVVAAALARLAVLMSEVLLLTATLLLCASELSTRSSLLERRLAFYELENPMRVTSLSLVDLSATTNPIYCMAMVPDEYIPLHPIRIVEPVSATHVQCKAPTRAAPS